jgi:N-hydroxyarylamine O-acetyltransferase
MLEGKSGYCFHLNGAFACLLKSLGYKISLHRAGVQSRGKEPCIDSNHLGLVVYLKDSSRQSEKWIVDVGLGDMIHEPLPLKSGAYNQGQFIYKVEDSHLCDGGWRLVHDPKGTFAGVDFDPFPIKDVSHFHTNHRSLSESPDSHWVNLLVAKNRHHTGSHSLIGCNFSFYDKSGFHSREVDNQVEWFDILTDTFGIDLTEYSSLKRDQMWKRAMEKHLGVEKGKSISVMYKYPLSTDICFCRWLF